MRDLPLLVFLAGTWHVVFSLAAWLPAFGDNSSRARGVSTLYGILVLVMVVSTLHQPPRLESGHSLFAIAAGYYLWALYLTLYERGCARLASLHHFCCFLCYGLSLDQELYPVLMRSGHIFLLAESSNACIHLRFFAFRAGRTQMARLWEILFILTFVATRFLIGMPLSANWWMHDLPRIPTPTLAVFYMASNVSWNAMNVFTLCRILSAYWRHGALRSPAALASGASRQEEADAQRQGSGKSQGDASTAPEKERVLSIQLAPYSSPCIDDDVACQLTISSALDCHMDLWFLPAPVRSRGQLDGSAAPLCRGAPHVNIVPLAPRRGQDQPPLEAAESRVCEMRPLRALDPKWVTRIHGKWYDLRDFKHPGGPVALSLVGGRDGTALFESHHPFTPREKLEQVLAKYLLPDQEEPRTAAALQGMIDTSDDGAHYVWRSEDAFEHELKQTVTNYFKGEAARRGVSLLEATKATPRRWLEIAVLWLVFASSVPALLGGSWWALVVTPVLGWVCMVNYWHDACHFALSSRWWINAGVPYLAPWFSSPTTWYHQHVIGHHAYPNVAHKDPDLAHAPQLLREHASIRWRKLHRSQHRIWRIGLVWWIAVGLGLHLAADAKLFVQQQYNRAVPAAPALRTRLTLARHLMGRLVYLGTTVVWPWLLFDSSLKAVLFATVPIGIFSLLFMLNSQINHLSPDTAHASSSNFWRHQVMTAQDFGAEGPAWHRLFCFFFSGGLNFQVEHHLFPTVCHCHLAALHPLVKQICEKHKVPFHERRGYGEALALHLAHTRKMGLGTHRD